MLTVGLLARCTSTALWSSLKVRTALVSLPFESGAAMRLKEVSSAMPEVTNIKITTTVKLIFFTLPKVYRRINQGGESPGSIKGDVKKKHFSLIPRKVFSYIQPLLCGGGLVTGAWIGLRVHLWLRRSERSLCACKQRVGSGPTMVLSETRDQARHYSFVGLSEGAYGAP